ncbi:MAG: TolC family protein [Burkholderiaceae bacterium]|nr:TolC family protein [Burkholderiaceae bacterium]
MTAWWLAFHDDTLTTLIDASLQAHSSVRSAQAALAQSRAQRDVTEAATLPGLRASGSAQRSGTGSGATSSAFRAGLDASWELDVFGARRLGVEAAEADLLAAAAQLGQARVSLAAEVALTYLEWLTQHQRLQVARQNLIWQEEAQQITLWRQQAGLASQLEVDQTTILVAQTRAAIAPIESSLQQTRNALAVLVGLPPQSSLPLPAEPVIPQWTGGDRPGHPDDHPAAASGCPSGRGACAGGGREARSGGRGFVSHLQSGRLHGLAGTAPDRPAGC